MGKCFHQGTNWVDSVILITAHFLFKPSLNFEVKIGDFRALENFTLRWWNLSQRKVALIDFLFLFLLAAISKEEVEDKSYDRGAKLPYGVNGFSEEFLDRLEPNGNIPSDKYGKSLLNFIWFRVVIGYKCLFQPQKSISDSKKEVEM